MKKFLFVSALVMMSTVLCFTSACKIVSISSRNEAENEFSIKEEDNIENSVITIEEPVVQTNKETDDDAPKDETPAADVYGFLYLNEAYDYGYLTQEDLLSLSYYYQSPDLNKELMGDEFVPKPSEMETLDEETEKEVVAALLEKTGWEYTSITVYWGTYNGCVIVWYSDPWIHFTEYDTPIYAVIGGVKLCVSAGDPYRNLAVVRLRKDKQ